MTPTDDPDVTTLVLRTQAILLAIDNTPIPDMDAPFYQHYFEELRLLVDEWLDTATARISPEPAGNGQ